MTTRQWGAKLKAEAAARAAAEAQPPRCPKCGSGNLWRGISSRDFILREACRDCDYRHPDPAEAR